MKVAVIGPLSKEVIVNNEGTELEAGGGVYHTGVGLHRLGVNAKVFPSLAKEDISLLGEFPKQLKKTPNFQNNTLYFSKEFDKKNNLVKQRMKIVKNIFEAKDLKKYSLLDFNLIVLTPLFNDNFPKDSIEYISELGIPLMLDMNGFLKHFKDGKVGFFNKENVFDIIKQSDFVIFQENEARYLTDEKEMVEQAKAIIRSGVSHVVIYDNNSNCVILEQKLYQIKGEKLDKNSNQSLFKHGFISGFVFGMQKFDDDYNKIGELALKTAKIVCERGMLNDLTVEMIIPE